MSNQTPQRPYVRHGEGFKTTLRAARIKRLARARIDQGGEPAKVVTALLAEYDDPDLALWKTFLLTELSND